jgi:hypothetical protein
VKTLVQGATGEFSRGGILPPQLLMQQIVEEGGVWLQAGFRALAVLLAAVHD